MTRFALFVGAALIASGCAFVGAPRPATLVHAASHAEMCQFVWERGTAAYWDARGFARDCGPPDFSLCGAPYTKAEDLAGIDHACQPPSNGGER